MGACGSCHSEGVTKEERERHASIEIALKKDRDKQKNELKVLILGTWVCSRNKRRRN
mgnify:CR=1 FL=1